MAQTPRCVDSSSELLLSEGDSGDLRVETRSQAVGRAQALVRKYVPPGVSLVDDSFRNGSGKLKEFGE
jgi:hypothetical protein